MLDLQRVAAQNVQLKNCVIDTTLAHCYKFWQVQSLDLFDCVLTMDVLHEMCCLKSVITMTKVTVNSSPSVERRLHEDRCLDGNFVSLGTGHEWDYTVMAINQNGSLPLGTNGLRLTCIAADVHCCVLLQPHFPRANLFKLKVED